MMVYILYKEVPRILACIIQMFKNLGADYVVLETGYSGKKLLPASRRSF